MDKMFVLFGTRHMLMILAGSIATLFLIGLGFVVRPKKIARITSILVLFVKLAEMYYRHVFIGQPITHMLPFHLCNMTIILAIFMMMFSSKILFQPVYYWFVGAIFAIATPDIIFDYPNFWTISFFITHFYLVFAALFALIHFHYRPTGKGLLASFLVINAWALCMYFVNERLGTNYLFVNHLTETKTLLNYLGPWPYYYLPVEGIYLMVSFALYMPFRKGSIKFGIIK